MTMTLKVCWIYLFSHSLINDFDADDDDDDNNDDVEGLLDLSFFHRPLNQTLGSGLPCPVWDSISPPAAQR